MQKLHQISIKIFKSIQNGSTWSYCEKNTFLKNTTCGIQQGSILGPLLFLIFMNNFKYVTNLLNAGNDYQCTSFLLYSDMWEE